MLYDASALISCYKAREFLPYKIDNILQSTSNIQIVIVECNNGKELELVSPEILNDHRIKIVTIDHRISVWKAINIAINISDSKYVVQANTDDLVHPQAYQKQIDKLNEGYDIVYFDYFISSGYHNTWDEAVKNSYTYYETPEDGYSTGNGLGMFPMWRKQLHFERNIGHFDDNLEIYGDSLFWTKLADAKKKFGHIPEKLGVYAQRTGGNLESNPQYAYNDKKYLDRLNGY